jgi:hypothetical protein
MGGRIDWSILFRSGFAVRRSTFAVRRSPLAVRRLAFAVRRAQAPFCDRIAEEAVIGTFSEIQQLDQTGIKCLGGLSAHPNDLSFCGRKYKKGKDLSTTLNANKRRTVNVERRT